MQIVKTLRIVKTRVDRAVGEERSAGCSGETQALTRSFLGWLAGKRARLDPSCGSVGKVEKRGSSGGFGCKEYPKAGPELEGALLVEVGQVAHESEQGRPGKQKGSQELSGEWEALPDKPLPSAKGAGEVQGCRLALAGWVSGVCVSCARCSAAEQGGAWASRYANAAGVIMEELM